MGEATHVEQVLRQTHIAYAVEVSSAPTHWRARFPSYSGMQFYVDPKQSRCGRDALGRDALHRAGLVKGMGGEV